MKRARLVTAATRLFSVGDIAIASCTSDGLADRGVIVTQSETESWPTVIGGGHILSPQLGVCGGMLDGFRLPGKHILSAAGVRTHDRDHQPWDWLREYRHLSVRDEESANAIGLAGIEIVPCTATLIRPFTLEQIKQIPRMQWVGSLPRSNYVVVHACESIIDNFALPSDAVAVEPQPHVDRSPVRRWRQVPLTHSPQVLAGVVANSRVVVTRSLHLAIFAMSAGVPFVAVDQGDDPQTVKLRRYFARAGLPEVVANPSDPVSYALELSARIQSVSQTEKVKASAHLDRIADVL